MKLRVFYILILGIMFPFHTLSQTLCCDGDLFHWEGGINAGLNTDGYEIDFRCVYFPSQYFGLKIGLGVAGELRKIEGWGRDDYGWIDIEWDYENAYATRFKFNPAIVLRTPRIIDWKSRNAGFYLFAEPGIVLSPGASGSRNAEYMRWDLKSGVNMQAYRFIFTIGYGISNFSLYSGWPFNYWGEPEKDNYITHSGFIGISCKF